MIFITTGIFYVESEVIILIVSDPFSLLIDHCNAHLSVVHDTTIFDGTGWQMDSRWEFCPAPWFRSWPRPKLSGIVSLYSQLVELVGSCTVFSILTKGLN